MRRALVAAALAAAACAPAVDPRSPFDVDDPRALREDVERQAANRAAGAGAPAEAVDPPAAAPPDADPPAADPAADPPLTIAAGGDVRGGTVLRTALEPVLTAGPGAFLGWFQTEAVMAGDRFAGWRFVGLAPAGRALADLDLRPGDVVVAVNGRPLSRPDELGDLWAELYRAGAIVVEVHRGEERFTLRFTISGPPLPVPPAPAR